MKRLSLCIILLGLVHSSFANSDQRARRIASKVCIADSVRANMTSEVHSRIEFDIFQQAQEKSLRNLIGHVYLTQPHLDQLAEGYYSLFQFKEILQNKNYRPRIYLDHIQFAQFNSAKSNSHDGGGMWGSFILKNDFSQAHYVFKAGDHIGGTLDYKCY